MHTGNVKTDMDLELPPYGKFADSTFEFVQKKTHELNNREDDIMVWAKQLQRKEEALEEYIHREKNRAESKLCPAC